MPLMRPQSSLRIDHTPTDERTHIVADLLPRTVFRDADSPGRNIYMMLVQPTHADLALNGYDVVNLATGGLVTFSGTDRVVGLDAKLTALEPTR